jgi:hypothetical protein
MPYLDLSRPTALSFTLPNGATFGRNALVPNPELGVRRPTFDTPRGIELEAAGRALLDRVRPALSQVDAPAKTVLRATDSRVDTRWFVDPLRALRAGVLHRLPDPGPQGAASSSPDLRWGLPKAGTNGIMAQMSEQIFHLRRLATAVALSLAVTGIPALAAVHTFDGVYSGKRVLTKGAASTECPAEDPVSVTIHDDTLTFTNSALEKFTEPFYPDPDGSFGETYTDEGGNTVHFHGRIVGNILDANVSNPDCAYHWHLTK